MARSGIIPHVGAFFGTTVQCDSESKSFYCQTVKYFNLLVIFGIIFFLLYMLLNKKMF